MSRARAWFPGWTLPLVMSAVLLGAAAFGAYSALAEPGDSLSGRHEPARDGPAALAAADLPPGELLEMLSEPRSHGPFVIYPTGEDPAPRVATEGDAGWVYEEFDLGGADTVESGLSVDAAVLPEGYAVVAAGGYRATAPSGETDVYQAGLTIEGPGYPITVERNRRPPSIAHDPIIMAVPGPGSYTMMTLGTVLDGPAIFLHRRPGVATAELQQVIVPEPDGVHVVVVGGYVDDFTKLTRVAESILQHARDEARD